MTPQTVATRLYALLIAAFAVGSLAAGLTFWYWSANGVPHSIVKTLQITEVTQRMLRGLGVFAVFFVCIAVLNSIFSLLIFRNHRWPAVLTTLGWCLLLVPIVRDTHNVPMAMVLALTVGLTITMMWPRSSA